MEKESQQFLIERDTVSFCLKGGPRRAYDNVTEDFRIRSSAGFTHWKREDVGDPIHSPVSEVEGLHPPVTHEQNADFSCLKPEQS